MGQTKDSVVYKAPGNLEQDTLVVSPSGRGTPRVAVCSIPYLNQGKKLRKPFFYREDRIKTREINFFPF